MNPASVARRGRRVLRLVDGNIFKFLLPGIWALLHVEGSHLKLAWVLHILSFSCADV